TRRSPVDMRLRRGYGRSALLPKRQPKHRRDGLGIADPATANHGQRFGQRDELGEDGLIGFRLRLPAADAAGQKDSHGFVEECRADVEIEYAPPAPGGVSGFFQQLALTGSQGALAAIDFARRQLPYIAASGVPVL